MIPVFKKVRLTFRVLGITVLVPCIKASTRGTFFLFAKSKTGLALYPLLSPYNEHCILKVHIII